MTLREETEAKIRKKNPTKSPNYIKVPALVRQTLGSANLNGEISTNRGRNATILSGRGKKGIKQDAIGYGRAENEKANRESTRSIAAPKYEGEGWRRRK